MAFFGGVKRRTVLGIVLVAALVLFVLARAEAPKTSGTKSLPPAALKSTPLPLQRAILSAMRPLEYSALPILLDPDVTLQMDFSKKVWTVGNFRRYDEKGDLLLAGRRFGLCAELTVHVYQQIKPLVGERYLLQFVRAAEPGFFDSAQSNHIVLLLTDRATRETFMIDPSFQRYGRVSSFPGYVIYDTKDALPSFTKNDKDVTFSLDGALPLVIRAGRLLAFSVEPVHGELDRKNIILAISDRRPPRKAEGYVLAVRKERGQINVFQNEALLARLLTPEERAALLAKLLVWIDKL